MEELIKKIVNVDPEEFANKTPEELAELYMAAKDIGGVIEKIKKESGNVLLTMFEGNGTIFGQFGVTRVTRPNFSKVSMDTAREYGAVIESVDTKKLGELVKKGVDISGLSYTIYPNVSRLGQAEEAEA